MYIFNIFIITLRWLILLLEKPWQFPLFKLIVQIVFHHNLSIFILVQSIFDIILDQWLLSITSIKKHKDWCCSLVVCINRSLWSRRFKSPSYHVFIPRYFLIDNNKFINRETLKLKMTLSKFKFDLLITFKIKNKKESIKILKEI